MTPVPDTDHERALLADRVRAAKAEEAERIALAIEAKAVLFEWATGSSNLAQPEEQVHAAFTAAARIARADHLDGPGLGLGGGGVG